jgi:hypothetical protein
MRMGVMEKKKAGSSDPAFSVKLSEVLRAT